ncbi:acyl-CoA thioesterase [Alicyclobacillus acidiphilus]|jgi:acyl-CoA thioester hydrolase|uniref:acyl-CoA thioesterase n=1 Tax=Alicyclobacillus acidiphilus TaxID=182455 RepID=UPI00082EE7CC|nr:thioesterase family protein [Alicyclobacillus acidiphilus]
MDGYRFNHELRVRWSEVDGQLIVYNANYLAYLDLAYSEYLRRELKLVEGVPPTVIVKSTLEFKSPAKFDDVLQIWVRTVRIGTKSFTVEFCITRDGEVIFEAETIYVYINPDGTSAPLPDKWRQVLESYERREHQ